MNQCKSCGRKIAGMSTDRIEELFEVVETRIESANEHLQRYLDESSRHEKTARGAAEDARFAARKADKAYRLWEPGERIDRKMKDHLRTAHELVEEAVEDTEWLTENTLATTGSRTLADFAEVAWDELLDAKGALVDLLNTNKRGHRISGMVPIEINGRETTLEKFLDVNADMNPELLERWEARILDLQPGESTELGGGAMGPLEVQRLE